MRVAAPEFADAAVVRLLIASQHAEGQILVAGLLELAGEDDADAVALKQQHRHHSRVKPLLLTGILGLGRAQDC
jgi:hypothetical protein